MVTKTRQAEYGWTAVPRDRNNISADAKSQTSNIEVVFEQIWPSSEVVKKAEAYAKDHLAKETYNHSLRVYCYGHTIVTQHFPAWIQGVKDDFFETWALTCLFHDIATTQENRNSTHLSFEFQGGFIALQQLQSFGAPQAQAESVCEAIVRHQDPGETGMISRMGQLVQLATEFGRLPQFPD